MIHALDRLDILIPVYQEGAAIRPVLAHLAAHVKTPARILLCYDHDTDTTLEHAIGFAPSPFKLELVKNEGVGVHGAIMTGFRRSDAPAVVVYPADDDTNGALLDRMLQLCAEGSDIVTPSRFMKGGCMKGCRWTKAALVRTAAFLLYHAAGLPTHDPTNGFRLFSNRVIRSIPVESTSGFAFSIELLVKSSRRGWKITELPAVWFERKQGQSRFRILKWMPVYLRWFFYAFQTRFKDFVWMFWLLGVLFLYVLTVLLPKFIEKI